MTQPATPTKTVAAMVQAAKAAIENLDPEQVAKEMERGAVVVDLREPAERRQNGAIPGAIHATRGMLEFHADPAAPYHIPALQPNKRTVLYCAAGGRSALGVRALKDLGYTNVAHLDGGFKAWAGAGKPVEEVKEP